MHQPVTPSMCPSSLQRKLWRVEPQVHTRSNFSAKIHVVVVQENHGHRFSQRLLRVKNAPNNVLPTSIVGVSFARIDNLEVAGVLGNLPETIKIGQDQVGTLVSRRAARKTNRE